MLAIYGAGGFALQILDMVADENPVFISDSTSVIRDFPVLTEVPAEARLAIAIADPAARRRIASLHSKFATLIAPTARVSRQASIGEGSILCDFTVVEASAAVGKQFHGNIYSYVAHESIIGDFVTFAPRVSCNGRVRIGDGAYIGSGACIRDGIVIGEGAIVGMGAIVTKDVAAGATVTGNPARAR